MLSIVEGRVLGCLLEKERTTPDQYPLTMNALVLACNQSTSRDPVMTLEPYDVETTIMSLKGASLLRIVHPSHGRSVARYRQVADEHHGWTPGEAALMAVLLLRGPQTIMELRSRTERMHDFGSIDALEDTLRDLAAREEPQAALLERMPGQKEPRWRQLIAEEAEATVGSRAAVASTADGRIAADSRAVVTPAALLAERVAELEDRMARLEEKLADLL